VARSDCAGRGYRGAVLVEQPALRDFYYVVAESTDVGADAPPRRVQVLGAELVLWRDAAGAVVAAPDRCPHREAPLSLGQVTAGCLTCCYHGWTFGAGGRCELVPSSGAGRAVPPAAHLRPLVVTECYGLVWLCPGRPRSAPPRIAQDGDPAFRRINSGVQTWRTSVTRMTDNFLDTAHFPYVHAGTFGIAAGTVVAPIELGPLDADFDGYVYEVDAANEQGAAASGQSGSVVHRRMTTGFHLPFTVRSTIEYATGLKHVILLCSTPIDDVTSYFTFVVWRNDDHTVAPEEVIALDRAIGAEDQRMLERVPGVLPLDAHATVSVQSDRASVEWRRRLAALLTGP
jgi:phenylpropionate dioxygenase-like ring-hydroxylating dioxygenase large terminal subunit